MDEIHLDESRLIRAGDEIPFGRRREQNNLISDSCA
jgi:hypothetical protein